MVSRVVHSLSFSSTPLLLSCPRIQSLKSCSLSLSWFSARFVSSSQERLAKRLSRSGVASRRESEKLIEQGKVFVNGKKATLKDNALVNEADVVTVFGKKIRKSHPKLWVHYKKAGLLVTNRPEEDGKPTLFPRLKEIMGVDHIISVGRLDFNSEGLLLLTNDGELARTLELPENEVERVYKVRLRGEIYPDILRQLERGPVVDGVKYKPMKVEIPEREGKPANKWITCTLSEGKNREIRRIFDSFSMPVSRIVRVKFGPYSLTTLAPGDTKQVPISWLGKIIDLQKLYPKEKGDENDHKYPKVSKNNINTETKISTSNIASVFSPPRKDTPEKLRQKPGTINQREKTNSKSAIPANISPTSKNHSKATTFPLHSSSKNSPPKLHAKNTTKNTPSKTSTTRSDIPKSGGAPAKIRPIAKNSSQPIPKKIGLAKKSSNI